MAKREASIVQAILRYLNALPECVAEKEHGSPYAHVGKADITGCLKGRTLKLEAKRPGEKATPIQLAYLAKWAKAGAITGVVTSVGEVKELME
jgi:hypothetical protein